MILSHLKLLGFSSLQICRAKRVLANKSVFFLLNVIVFSIPVNAQVLKIEGNILDSNHNPVISANVLIRNQAHNILLFEDSDSKGYFSFEIADSLLNQSLYIEIRAFGFKIQSKQIISAKEFYSFILQHDYKLLKNIDISKPPVESHGDTLTFYTQAFSQPEDRSIGDVIRRMPGMTVTENGEILFMGNRINNLLIHSDDLMGGRYGLATQVISKDLINKIEVIQHYQPITALTNKVHTDDIAVNLVLEDENKLSLSGQVDLGAGIPSKLIAGTDLILLNKKIKMLNSLKYNNIGIDYRSYFENFTQSEADINNQLLSDAIVDNPGLPLKYIYDNNSFYIGANNLLNTKDTLQIRSNIRFFNDRNYLDYNSNTNTFLKNDTLVYRASQEVERMPRWFDFDLGFIMNKSKYYLKNQTIIHLRKEKNRSNLNFNENKFSQVLTGRIKDFENHFQWIPQLLKRDIVNISWDMGYNSVPQSLLINTGIDSVLLNNGESYESVLQTAEVNTASNKVTIDYIVNNRKKLKSSYQLGIQQKWQNFESKIALRQWNGDETQYTGDAGNNLKWNQSAIYFAPTFWFKNENLNINLSIPTGLKRISYIQKDYNVNEKNNYFFWSPQFKGEYFFNSENSFSTSFIHNKRFGVIGDVYKGIIIKNFRQINSNESFVREIKNNRFTFQYNLKHSISLFFLHAGFSWNQQIFNSVYSVDFKDNIQITKTLPIPNKGLDRSYFVILSKYFFPLETKAELTGRYTLSKIQQYINGELLPFAMRNQLLDLNISSKAIDFLSIDYSGTARWFRSFSGEYQNGSLPLAPVIRIFDHDLSLSYTPEIPVSFTVRARYQSNRSMTNSASSYFFLDANARFNNKKHKIDFEIGVDNLLNVREFNSYNLFANQLFSSKYFLNGRVAYVKATLIL